MSDLIDTTEMYLRTVFELEEEGVVPMRARIAERLSQSGPTVSQTVARMERDGLVVVGDDRQLELTPAGREAAVRVMRKHRLAECLLVEVLGMPWEEVHAEACRWEHVMSESVERRVYELLHEPTTSPYGNPIPGLDELVPGSVAMAHGAMAPLSDVAAIDVRRVIVRRIAEPLQDNSSVMTLLHRVGAMPGASVTVHRSPGGITVGSAGEYAELSDEVTSHLLVELGSTVET
ncbi:MAG: metal-dependent transcriptional regulator [Actinomycetes bacterium]|jgi:DtxR family Mn-dependent transcriptional regulator